MITKLLCYSYIPSMNSCTVIFLLFLVYSSCAAEDTVGNGRPQYRNPTNATRHSVIRYGPSWSAWTYSECQHGRQVRARACRTWGKRSCPGHARQTLKCTPPLRSRPQSLPQAPNERGRHFISPTFGAVWSPWSAWTECYKSRQDRVRACHRRIGYRCAGAAHQARQCNEGDETPAETQWRQSQRFYGFDKDRLIKPVTTPKPNIFNPQDYLRMNPHDLSKDWAMAQLGIGQRSWFRLTTPGPENLYSSAISTTGRPAQHGIPEATLAPIRTTNPNLTLVADERQREILVYSTLPPLFPAPIRTTPPPTTSIATEPAVPSPRFNQELIKLMLDRKSRPATVPQYPFEMRAAEPVQTRPKIALIMPPPPPDNPISEDFVLENPRQRLRQTGRRHKSVEGLSSEEHSAWNFGSLASPSQRLAEKFGISQPIPTVPAEEPLEASKEKASLETVSKELQATFKDVLIKYYEELLKKHGLKLKRKPVPQTPSATSQQSEIKFLEATTSTTSTTTTPPYPIPHPEPNYAQKPAAESATIPKPEALISSPRREPMQFSDYTPIFIPTSVMTTTPLPHTESEAESNGGEVGIEEEGVQQLRPLRVRDDLDGAIPEHRSRRIEPWSAPLVYGPNLKPTSNELRSINQNTPTYWLYTVFKDQRRRKNQRRSSRTRNSPSEKEKGHRQRGRADSVSNRNDVTFLPGFGQANSAHWSSWSAWSSCVRGKESRTRRCNYDNSFLTIGCAGPSYQVKNCGWSSLLDLLPDPSGVDVPWEVPETSLDDVVDDKPRVRPEHERLIVFNEGAPTEEALHNRLRKSRRKFAALQRRRFRFRVRI